MKKRVLHVIGYLGKGGDTTAVENVYGYILKCNLNYHFDYLTHNGCDLDFVKKVKKRGSKVFIFPGDVRKIGLINYYKRIKKVLKQGNYDIVHFHTSFQSFIGLIAAKRCGVGVRVCHSHTSAMQRKMNLLIKGPIVFISKLFINKYSTHKVACSKAAGDNLFFKSYSIIYNGLNIDKILELSNERVSFLDNLKKKNRIIVGQVGRLTDMKNPEFTLNIVEKINNLKYEFVFLGDGSMFNELKVKEKIFNNIHFLGSVENPYKYMKYFDFLLLPSKYGEGLPVVLIEEQIINSNCMCIASDCVTKEANIGNVLYENIQYLNKWIEILKSDKKCNKVDYFSFDIKNTVKKWLTLYE